MEQLNDAAGLAEVSAADVDPSIIVPATLTRKKLGRGFSSLSRFSSTWGSPFISFCSICIFSTFTSMNGASGSLGAH